MPPRKAPASRRSRGARITHKEVDARYDRAKELARAGAHAEALAEFLWCYDVGMVAVASFFGVRTSFLLSAIASLGKAYPPALQALRSRRDAVEHAIASDPGGAKGLSEYSSLNHYLKEDEKTLALFDQIPAGDPRRARMGLSVSRLLAGAGRYAEALEAHPFDRMIELFDDVIQTCAPSHFSDEDKAELEQSIRGHAVRSAANNIEVLAGAGAFDAAREYVAKVLAYDDTLGTRSLLADAFARAGRPESWSLVEGATGLGTRRLRERESAGNQGAAGATRRRRKTRGPASG